MKRAPRWASPTVVERPLPPRRPRLKEQGGEGDRVRRHRRHRQRPDDAHRRRHEQQQCADRPCRRRRPMGIWSATLPSATKRDEEGRVLRREPDGDAVDRQDGRSRRGLDRAERPARAAGRHRGDEDHRAHGAGAPVADRRRHAAREQERQRRDADQEPAREVRAASRWCRRRRGPRARRRSRARARWRRSPITSPRRAGGATALIQYSDSRNITPIAAEKTEAQREPGGVGEE